MIPFLRGVWWVIKALAVLAGWAYCVTALVGAFGSWVGIAALIATACGIGGMVSYSYDKDMKEARK